MKHIKRITEAFSSNNLSKVINLYKKDKLFKDRLFKDMNSWDIILSELTDDDVLVLTTDEALEIKGRDSNTIISDTNRYLIYWFNDKTGYDLSTDNGFNKNQSNNLYYPSELSKRKNVIRDNFDFCVAIKIESDNESDVKNGLSIIKSIRSENSPIKLDLKQIKQSNIDRYFKILSDRIDIQPDDKSLMVNFSHYITKYFNRIDPILYFSHNVDSELTSILRLYQEIFMYEYDDLSYYVERIRNYLNKLYKYKAKLIDKSLIIISDDNKMGLVNQLYEINDKLKSELINFKIDKVEDIFTYTSVISSIKTNSALTAFINYLTHEDKFYKIEGVSDNGIKKLQIEINIFKSHIDYIFKK